MIYTKTEEIALVEQNLEIIREFLPEQLVTRLLTPTIRADQHPLFFTLCNPKIYPYVIDALNVLKESKHFKKAITKLKSNVASYDHQANVYEVITVAHYYKELRGKNGFEVVWERVVSADGKSVDVSILGYELPINIEITAKFMDAKIERFIELRYKVKVAIEKKLLKKNIQGNRFIFSIPTIENQGNQFDSLFQSSDIDEFTEFILHAYSKGQGEYEFEKNGNLIASITISPLPEGVDSYASHLDMWRGWLNDSTKIKNKVLEKAEYQLPRGEINFVLVPNLGGFDDIDYQEAFWGQEQHALIGDKLKEIQRKKNGIASLIEEKGLSPIHGLIYSGWDYSKRKILVNPLSQPDLKYLQLISM